MWMCKEWWMIKKNVEALEMRCFLPDYQKNWTKKHDESLLFDYPIYSLSFDYPILPNSEERSCNCRNKDNCSLAGSCLKTCIVYRADIITQSETHIYYGASDGEFKYRYNNHTNSSRNHGYENKTELSKHIWQLKRYGIEFNLKWSIAAYATPYRCTTRRCDLCLTEKYIIARANQNNLLNKRTELMSKCRHRNKYILKNIWYILNWFAMEQFKS